MTTAPLFHTVSELLPHAGSMVLIDQVIKWGDSFLEALVKHEQPGIFTDENNHVPAWVGIEYMAQTISAWVGIQSRRKGEPIRIGFLLGTRSYVSHIQSFAPGQEVRVRARKIMLDDENNLALFDCHIRAEDHSLLASAQIKAIQPENPEELLTQL